MDWAKAVAAARRAGGSPQSRPPGKRCSDEVEVSIATGGQERIRPQLAASYSCSLLYGSTYLSEVVRAVVRFATSHSLRL
jgi:hypothetical protein